MKSSELAIRNFVKALHLADRVRDQNFETFVAVANDAGYLFSDDDAVKVLQQMKRDNEDLPSWLSERIGHINDGRPWPD